MAIFPINPSRNFNVAAAITRRNKFGAYDNVDRDVYQLNPSGDLSTINSTFRTTEFYHYNVTAGTGNYTLYNGNSSRTGNLTNCKIQFSTSGSVIGPEIRFTFNQDSVNSTGYLAYKATNEIIFDEDLVISKIHASVLNGTWQVNTFGAKKTV